MSNPRRCYSLPSRFLPVILSAANGLACESIHGVERPCVRQRNRVTGAPGLAPFETWEPSNSANARDAENVDE
jgi:hypothetical protein